MVFSRHADGHLSDGSAGLILLPAPYTAQRDWFTKKRAKVLQISYLSKLFSLFSVFFHFSVLTVAFRVYKNAHEVFVVLFFFGIRLPLRANCRNSMPEALLHYIWQSRLFMPYPQVTTDGRRVEVLSVGQHNLHAGPDFTNVRLRICNRSDEPSLFPQEYVELAGNVEMHVESSDWYRHRHNEDKAYDSVLLHVVRHADKPVCTTTGKPILQLELNYPQPEDYISRMLQAAKQMDSPAATHPCARQLLAEPLLLTDGWKQTLLNMRLHCKTESIHRVLQLSHNDWEQALYITLAHQMGFHVNGVPMEMLALATPLPVIRKHRNDIQQIEALLLGQAGLLSEEDDAAWLREYRFMQAKFNLTPIDGTVWKRARMRPPNQPVVRIRQFAQILCQQDFLLSQILELTDLDDLRRLFSGAGMGKESVDILLINVVVPMKYAHRQQEQAIALLERIPAENNRVIRQWKMLGQRVENAADTQALLHLFMTYCQQEKCINCEVAYQIFLAYENNTASGGKDHRPAT